MIACISCDRYVTATRDVFDIASCTALYSILCVQILSMMILTVGLDPFFALCPVRLASPPRTVVNFWFEGVCVNYRHPDPRRGEPRVCSAPHVAFPLDPLDPVDPLQNSGRLKK